MNKEFLLSILNSSLIIIAGYFCAKYLLKKIRTTLIRKIKNQQLFLLTKAVKYLIATILLTLALQQLGFDITALIGAAGFLTVAIGFASRTIISNFISGLFLMFEDVINIGDHIEVIGNEGVLQSIDLLSIKLRRNNSTIIRIPNEKVLISETINFSKSGIAIEVLKVNVKLGSDIKSSISQVFSIINGNEYILKNPEPEVLISNIKGTMAIIECKVYVDSSCVLNMKDAFFTDINEAYSSNKLLLPS